MKPKLNSSGAGGARLATVIFLLLLVLGVSARRALAQSSLDFGDAPAPYPTLVSSNGARHTATGPLLGTLRDTENDGLPNLSALGDDSTGLDDEDGIVFISAVVPGQTATVQVTVTAGPTGGSARLDAWLDFDANGSWAEAADHIFASRVVTNGVNVLSFPVPAAAKIGITFARFRISTLGDLAFTGSAQDGEVEDYRVGISEPMDFGDAPTNNYATLLLQNGARHRIVSNFMLGTKIDSEPDGQPNPTATGDDLNPTAADDEDGISFLTPLVAGSNASVQVVCTMNATQTGRLNAWVDFTRDGDWADAGEQIFADVTVVNGTNNLSFAVPSWAAGGRTFARFRLNANGKIGPTGFTTEGEVEDYLVNVTAALDYGDAPSPYPTVLKDNGARHVFTNTFCLGTSVDGETDGQPDPDAKGDDSNPPGATDDEDGVFFTSSIVPGQTASLEVYVTLPAGANAGILNAWMDFNQDGDWADAGEQIFADRAVGAGINPLTFSVPSTALQGLTYARFRLSSARALSFVGLAADGEVEDYEVNISSGPLDFGDAPRPYPTLLVVNGARHVFNPDVFLGFRVDAEPDGQPDPNALGDDLNGPDEDGVAFTTPLVPGAPASVQVRASTSGFLNAWIDFDANGSWAEAGEKIFSGTALAGGVNNLSFTVPASAKTGATFARFRFNQQVQVLDFVGLGPGGEVEDYRVSIIPDRERCDLDCEGREFWLTFPGNYAPDPDNPARLSFCIHGPGGTAVAISAPGIGFNTNIVIPAVQSATVGLPRAVELGDLNDVVTNKGIHVVASAPIGIQAFDHAKFTTDSYLALHTSVIGTEYVVESFGNLHSGVPTLNGTQFALVASESNTVVTIIPSVATGVHPGGLPYNLLLQPGDAYQLRNTNDAPSDLTGTIIKSDKPIAVFGSHQCANVPSANEWFCDYLVEQLLPVNTWGSDFYTAPLATRTGGDTFRALAAFDNTEIFLDGVSVGIVNRGQFLQGPIAAGAHLNSTRPILVTQYANSGDYDGNTNADPFMLTVQAVRHYASSYRICTPTNDFPTNFVNLIALSGFIGGIQIDGVPIPGPFTAIGPSGYSYARVLITPGSHLVAGGVPFAASVYGWAEYDSYGHPGCFFFGDVAPPRVTSPVASVTASVNDFPNTPGLVPTPDLASATQVQDNCDPQLRSPDQTPKPATLVPPGLYTISLTVQDSTGNIGESNVTFTVLDPSPVIIECPSNLVVNCSSNNGAVLYFTVTAHSTYDPNVPVVSTPPSGSFFPSGTTVVTNVATSLAGQSNSCSFSVTVLCDTRVQLVRGPNGLTISWSGMGTLETTTDLGGRWVPVENAVSPYPVTLMGPRQFFRVRFN
jgi:hypothetical protein